MTDHALYSVEHLVRRADEYELRHWQGVYRKTNHDGCSHTRESFDCLRAKHLTPDYVPAIRNRVAANIADGGVRDTTAGPGHQIQVQRGIGHFFSPQTRRA